MLTWAGDPAVLVLPGAASGDVTRSYLVLRRRNDAAPSTILVDRFGLHSLLFLGAVSTACLIAKGSNGWVLQTVASLTWFSCSWH